MQYHSTLGPLSGAFAQSLPSKFPQPVFGALSKILQFEAADGIYAELTRDGSPETFVERLLERLQVEIKVSTEDLERIPKSGPVLAVANHPFGIFDGVVLTHLLPQIRPDVKILANFLLKQFPEVASKIILVDPFGGPDAKAANLRGMREARKWLAAGGMLVVFPAGEVSSLQFQFPRVEVGDSAWSDSIARLLRQSKATAVPLFFDGRNSVLFHLAGLLHPRLRTALLPHELLNKQHRTLELRCGAPIPPSRIEQIESDEKLTSHLRWRTYLLARRDRPRTAPRFKGRPIASAVDPKALMQELNTEPLLEAGEFQVFAAPGREIPNLLQEIGRLREITFRQAGEGTGRSRDLDRFDPHYVHLILWQKDKGEIAGSYRLGLVNDLVARLGLRGLYTHTLFHFDRKFLRQMGPAIELGRSFIRVEYQRSYQPLLLLWKGIGRFVLEHAPAHVLFGPVSISAEYSRASRELIASVLSRQNNNLALSDLVAPRKPLKQRLSVSPSCDLEELGDLIVDLEADRKSMPVLLRQYLKMGGQLVSFNVDPKFNHCVDGLIVVDLAQTDPRLLERYMGAPGARRFLDQNREGRLGGLSLAQHRPV